jgi:glycosyltransferase involved in cell wall biosynthesis
MPTIAVIIPARNEEAYIRGALESVDAQEYPPDSLERIVVDNASSDGTAPVVRAYVEEHQDLAIALVCDPLAGVARAKNAGAAQSKGEILLFLDADSRMAPDLARAVAHSHRAGNLVGSIRVVADGGSAIDRAFFQLMEFGKVRFGIRAQMLYCDRALFWELGGFDSTLHLGEDVDLLSRAGRLLSERELPAVCHITESEIMTSPRRLAAHHHLGLVRMFVRWLLAFAGIGRGRSY